MIRSKRERHSRSRRFAACTVSPSPLSPPSSAAASASFWRPSARRTSSSRASLLKFPGAERSAPPSAPCPRPQRAPQSSSHPHPPRPACPAPRASRSRRSWAHPPEALPSRRSISGGRARGRCRPPCCPGCRRRTLGTSCCCCCRGRRPPASAPAPGGRRGGRRPDCVRVSPAPPAGLRTSEESVVEAPSVGRRAAEGAPSVGFDKGSRRVRAASRDRHGACQVADRCRMGGGCGKTNRRAACPTADAAPIQVDASASPPLGDLHLPCELRH